MFNITSKIWKQLLLTIALVLLVVWACMITWQSYMYRTSAIEQASQFAESMHNVTMAGLTGMMVTGTIAQRDVFLEQIKQLGTIRDVRVLRGENVTKTFGPGTAAEQATAPDRFEQEVLQTGKGMIQVEQDGQSEYLRSIRPA